VSIQDIQGGGGTEGTGEHSET